jgi:TIR domain
MHPRADAHSGQKSTGPTVFVSYAQVDKDRAEGIKSFLEAQGFRILSLDDDLPVGADLFGELQRRLEIADAIIVLLSKASRASQWFLSEIGSVVTASIRRGRQIIPVKLDKNAEIPPFLRSLVVLDLSNERDERRELGRLVEALRQEPHTTLGEENELKLEALERNTDLLRHEEAAYTATHTTIDTRFKVLFLSVFGLTVLSLTLNIVIALLQPIPADQAQAFSDTLKTLSSTGFGALLGLIGARVSSPSGRGGDRG